MFENLQYTSKDFAAAYIQTLPHAVAVSIEEFNNSHDYSEYMDERREAFFHQYIDAIKFVNTFSRDDEEINKDEM